MPRSVRTLGAAGGGSPGLGLSLQGPRGMGKALRELSAEEQQELRRKINSRERKRMQDLNVAMDALREVMVPYSSSSSSSASLSGQHHQQLQQQQPQAHPYLAGSQGPGGPQAGRRLSKISTLVLARNYILLLASSLQEMRRLLGELSMGASGGGGVGGMGMGVPRVLLTAGGWPLLASAPAGQLLLGPEALLAPAPVPASASSSSKCPLLPAPLPQEEVAVWGSSSGTVTSGPLCPCGVCRVPRMVHSTPGPRFPK